MNVSLSPETQKLLEAHMSRGKFTEPDEVLRIALQTLDQLEAEEYEDLDPQVLAAIDDAEAQHLRGEGRPWSEVREEIRARFIEK